MEEGVLPEPAVAEAPGHRCRTKPWVIASLTLLLAGFATCAIVAGAFVREEQWTAKALEKKVAELRTELAHIEMQMERQRTELQRRVDLVETDLAKLQLAFPSAEDLQTRLQRLERRVTALEIGTWTVDASDILPPLGCSAGDYAVWGLFGLGC